MSTTPYNRQLLTCHAYGAIGDAGQSGAGFGCSMRRQSQGIYQMVLDDNNGVVEGQSFSFGMAKQPTAGTIGRNISVKDTSNQVKTLFVFDNDGNLIDNDVEITLWKSPI